MTTDPIEFERRQRIWNRKQLSAVTFGIELRGKSVMLERDWDRLAENIEPGMGTCHPLLDDFFAKYFTPMSTSWVHHHPDLEGIGRTFDRYVLIMSGCFDFANPRYAALCMQKR